MIAALQSSLSAKDMELEVLCSSLLLFTHQEKLNTYTNLCEVVSTVQSTFHTFLRTIARFPIFVSSVFPHTDS